MSDKNLCIEHSISVKDFLKLREEAGFQKLTFEQVEKILKNTSYISVVSYAGEKIGVTRLLFDFGTDAYITDVIVAPDFQGHGIGRILINDVIDFLKKNSLENIIVTCSLYANPGKEGFYEKFGFKILPSGKYGYGMILEI